jgi:hypothetical protein
MAGLKSYLAGLSAHLDRSAAALYERQRALVRLGLLDQTAGFGPGSGVRATPETVSLLLLSVMVTDNLSEMDVRVSKLAAARVDKRSLKQNLTKALTFGRAVSAVLDDPELAKKVAGISVDRRDLTATIGWYGEKFQFTRFGEGIGWELERPAFSVQAHLEGHAIHAIAKSLRESEKQ